MAERYEELDVAIEAVLGSGTASNAELRELLAVAAELTFMPRQSFRDRLKQQLVSGGTMEATVTPYLISTEAPQLIEFIKSVFGAEELERGTGSAGGLHCELLVGDSKVMVGGGGPVKESMPQALHVYVRDVDNVHARAVAAGATELMPPGDREYGDRDSALTDPYGNHWYIGTHGGASYRPEILRDVTPYFHVQGAARFIDFLVAGLAGTVVERDETPAGAIQHAKLRLGNSVIELSEARGEFGAMPAMMYMLVADADAAVKRAVGAGARVISEPAEQSYGARVGAVEDEFGNQWYLAAAK
jgi:uncharacterized glyoxalase superfamily protein PhnB